MSALVGRHRTITSGQLGKAIMSDAERAPEINVFPVTGRRCLSTIVLSTGVVGWARRWKLNKRCVQVDNVIFFNIFHCDVNGLSGIFGTSGSFDLGLL